VLGENLPQCHFSTTNPTWPDVGSNPGRRGGKWATNRLSYGTAHKAPKSGCVALGPRCESGTSEVLITWSLNY
jgi:hypothetical protein